MHSNILDKFKDFKKSIVFEPFIFIEISSQNLKLISKDKVFKSYSISSSKHGIGMQLNSNKTPIGGHIVSEKIGGGEKINTIFKGRVPTHVSESNLYDANADTITSRILWLEGLEEGFNKGGNLDSKNRYIYIHGTTVSYTHLRAHET